MFIHPFLALFQEIKGRQEDFMRAFNAGDAKGAAEVYDPDGWFSIVTLYSLQYSGTFNH
jgi:hypothetical protein